MTTILVSSKSYMGSEEQNSDEFNIGSGEDNSGGGMSSSSGEDDSNEYNNF